MYILIHGKSGSGKSNLGDLIRNELFKIDSDCTININDEDRNIKTFGSGKTQHTINVVRILEEGNEARADIIIDIKNSSFMEWFQKNN